MKKTIICGVVVVLFTAAALPTMGVVELEGTIEAEITTSWLGVVIPVVNLTENQTICLDVSGSNGNFYVNETLRINLGKTGNFTRRLPFILPRYLFVQVFVLQKKILPLRSIIRGKARKTFLLNDPLIGDDKNMSTPYIDISMNYQISEGIVSENLTMYVFAMGILPGSSNENKTVPLEYKKINLRVDYSLPE